MLYLDYVMDRFMLTPMLNHVGHMQIVLSVILCATLPCRFLQVASQTSSFSFSEFSSADLFILVNDVQHNQSDSAFYINPQGASLAKQSCGKLLYNEKVRVVDLSAGTAASFNTSFTFSITSQNLSSSDSYYIPKYWRPGGLAFTFIAEKISTAQIPAAGDISCMCLIAEKDNVQPTSRLFAVEFDTFWNNEFNDPSDSHIGVNIHSMNSTEIKNFCPGPKPMNCSYLRSGKDFTAWIDYYSPTGLLEVRFAEGSLATNLTKPAAYVVQMTSLDLSTLFKEYMYVGFSGSTASNSFSEVHKIMSWSFASSGMPEAPAPAPLPGSPAPLPGSPTPSPSPPTSSEVLPPNPAAPGPLRQARPLPHGAHGSKVALISSICGVLVVFSLLGAVFALCVRERKRRASTKNQGRPTTIPINHLLGPRMFAYKELKKATKNFSESQLLGTGGFGAVYKGALQPSGDVVAVKRIRHESKQGEEGFLAEASSISQIRHRNLVQLQGCCHERGHLLLVYDYMPNGSLDQWIFKSHRNDEGHDPNTVLPWNLRLKVIAGVAAALAYLHDEWQQCVLHRDIKSSNVLLDADFNARLADFGLARLIDHEKEEKTTMMAGTLGYMAPEMPHTGKATKETDVYSFGVLVLEVVCGRRPLNRSATNPADLILVDCVWRAHEAGDLLSVADPRLLKSTTTDQILDMSTVQDMTKLQSNSSQSQSNASSSVDSSKTSRGSDQINVDSESCNAAASPPLVDASSVVAAPPNQSSLEDSNKMVRHLLRLGLLCCQANPNARPSMRAVNQWLQSSHGDDLDASLPALPAFKPQVHYRIGSGSSPLDLSFADSDTRSTAPTLVYLSAEKNTPSITT